MTFQSIKRKWKKLCRKWDTLSKKCKTKQYEAKRKRICSQIACRDFSVISNNCWGGSVYRYLKMPYLSPTAGLYFFAEDYIKFASNIEHYLKSELRFIEPKESKYYQILLQRNQIEKPIGKVDDVEIIFLHYTSKEEAREKWVRRAARVNYSHLVFKMSNMNLCSETEMKAFAQLPYKHKILLNNRKKKIYSCEVYWKGYDDKPDIANDTEKFPGNINLAALLNFDSLNEE